MRVTIAFNRLLALSGATVADEPFPDKDTVLADIRLRALRLRCSERGFTTSARYDTRPVFSTLRHADVGRRPRSGFTREFEDVTAYLATKPTRPPSPGSCAWGASVLVS